MPLRLESPTLDAQAASGLGKTQWDIFLKITRKEAETLYSAHPSITWTNLDAHVQWVSSARIIDALEEVQIPTGGITEDIIRWRMVKAINYIMVRPRPPAPTASLPYDPVRDF
ncbi:hypothetical protein P154DRAFT_565725 [Amniculicola lignicola CBS 123094]|uniref:Uncharacterized protein n=1 Tax=Amniculicola lignicola CBS 123094 TaxID=1392246 RepID=A0A6A5W836_9PLEO|nr:hypothetical protein P154DRAFT_565725 [Amniculicola lignicola CBS 123094]